MKTIYIVMVVMLMTISNSVYGQALTQEQIDADIMRQQKIDEDAAIAQLSSALEIVSEQDMIITPQQAKNLQYVNAVKEFLSPWNQVVTKPKTSRLAVTQSGASPLLNTTDEQLVRIPSGGTPFKKTVISPYLTYGIAELTNWKTDFRQGYYYPWYDTARTLVMTNGPAARSYIQSLMPPNCVSYMYATITNHYNEYGDPVWHTLKAWYTAHNSYAFYSQAFRCSVHDWQFLLSGSTNLPMSSEWRRFETKVPPFSEPQSLVFFVQFQGSQQYGVSPFGDVDNSVQWQPYEPDWVGLNCLFENQNMTLTWDIYYQPTNHWHLTYADNLSGPWASNTAPITINGNIGSITFTNTGDIRFYKLRHH